jgi:pyrroloquinoline quinone (PQQ) biosynthesis protein C
MSRFDEVVTATQPEYERAIGSNALFKRFVERTVKMEHYIAYLRETYHLVRHTSRMLSLAGARFTDDRRDLREWFFEQAREENGHDLFCIKDLKNLGFDPVEVLSGRPSEGAWGLVAQNYYMATYGNPVGILGVASATEGLGASIAGDTAALVEQHLGVPHNATTFLRSHAGFDLKHLDEAKRAINDMIHTEEDLLDVIQGRRMTLRYYGRLFDDVANRGDATFSKAA